ncbi:uncharacterized protein E0L32_011117 [Thyridium curvatum]|uniref:Uncharacterized protein n=1 Tax=Thyridium curvatum TaxID=1093900 RepID=A0A507AET7_9PEZI|nr:uncharacterized protein E0L32_011117 [Thyridium curvatum]TPX06972.1 hypothetical protein E0L32_011117 [Thyridium curvatum]
MPMPMPLRLGLLNPTHNRLHLHPRHEPPQEPKHPDPSQRAVPPAPPAQPPPRAAAAAAPLQDRTARRLPQDRDAAVQRHGELAARAAPTLLRAGAAAAAARPPPVRVRRRVHGGVHGAREQEDGPDRQRAVRGRPLPDAQGPRQQPRPGQRRRREHAVPVPAPVRRDAGHVVAPPRRPPGDHPRRGEQARPGLAARGAQRDVQRRGEGVPAREGEGAVRERREHEDGAQGELGGRHLAQAREEVDAAAPGGDAVRSARPEGRHGVVAEEGELADGEAQGVDGRRLGEAEGDEAGARPGAGRGGGLSGKGLQRRRGQGGGPSVPHAAVCIVVVVVVFVATALPPRGLRGHALLGVGLVSARQVLSGPDPAQVGARVVRRQPVPAAVAPDDVALLDKGDVRDVEQHLDDGEAEKRLRLVVAGAGAAQVDKVVRLEDQIQREEEIPWHASLAEEHPLEGDGEDEPGQDVGCHLG